jgi:hypothetical protein
VIDALEMWPAAGTSSFEAGQLGSDLCWE